MLYIKALHIIAMVAWFAGLFYLPRLFVYHSEAHDTISLERFKIMERRLYKGIMWPAGIMTTIFGVWLITYMPRYYLIAGWMHAKLTLVVILWAYHVCCGRMVRLFAQGKNTHTSKFYRVFNELPTLFLISIVILVVVRPF